MSRSVRQHRSEWFYYRLIASWTGHTAYEVYEIMTKLFLLTVDEEGNLGIIRPTSLTTVEHNEYLEQIRCFMAGFEFYLPEPNEIPTEDYIIKII
ncbi:MAG TPA: hypothetical protein PKU82_04570 [Bacteroidia bacterium]|nr:hypothetical protein [Bacteroidia bacterium]HOZ90868.1 hypothetical protein [Bacteroidia bacterium]HRB52126.1 hypothetical protein [Bacteroidia bacterium]